jgi:hypothetical protein
MLLKNDLVQMDCGMMVQVVGVMLIYMEKDVVVQYLDVVEIVQRDIMMMDVHVEK